MKEKIYRWLLIAALVIALLLGATTRRAEQNVAQAIQENTRLSAERTTLTRQLHYYRTLAGESAASVEALRLHAETLERLRTADAEIIKNLQLRLRRVESITTTAIKGDYSAVAPIITDTTTTLGDTMPLPSAVRRFEWSDTWATVKGEIRGDSVACRVTTIDTLRQIIHRVPYRFLFFRFGTRALQQEIISSNPHNRIVYAEYIEVEK